MLEDGSEAGRGSRRAMTGQVLMGLFVIAVGLLFLLDNLDIIELREALAFWPIVFIFAGLAKLLDTSTPHGYLVGLAGIAIGTAMILNRLGLIDFSWRMSWPLVVIGAGVFLVYRATRRQGAGHGMADDKSSAFMPGEEDRQLDASAILAGVERRVHSQDFRGGEVSAVMGGCSLDMRGASIAAGEAVIDVFAFWGGVTILCPPDWSVVLQGTPILGSFDDKTVRPPDNRKRLVIRGYAIMGGVEVRN